MNGRKSVFKDESKLDINYVPKTLPHREKEHRLLMEFFSFLLRFSEKMSQRIIITGEVGTGKTVLAHRFGADITLQANKQKVKLRYVHVNCREYRGKIFLILQHVLTIFRPNFPKRGYSSEEILDMLFQILDEENTHIILTLDEFDTLIKNEGSETVYKLTRLQEIRSGKPQRISAIFILRDLSLIDKLDDSSRSTLQRNIIRLIKYRRNQLIDILNERIALGFNLYSVNEDVISSIAELGFSESGNARFAIDLLWRAGKYADASDKEVVTAECVREAISSIFPTIRKNELDSLSLHEKIFLLAIARFFNNNENAYTSLSEIEEYYAIACEEFNEKPNSHTQIWKYTQLFSALGILKIEVTATSKRGRSTKISLPSIPSKELEKELSAALRNNNM
ncbi:MAG: ORC1-type DNA replication protein [Candidatus Bathyarchaeota archaeon]|nr:ORC1-type DNA replication protein [Candidatus Bathyarchaeota archaeon]